jgi:hypothetical protein
MQQNSMSNKKNQVKSDIARLILRMAEDESSDSHTAREFLATEDVNVDRMLGDGMKKIKRAQMEIEAKKTEEEMNSVAGERDRATKWVDDLLSTVGFSFNDFVKKEELVLNFRNVESLSHEDIRTILIRHFTLKFSNEKKGKDK